jgi:molybdopterin-guanine dinucleotide biosynthesis protein A
MRATRTEGALGSAKPASPVAAFILAGGASRRMGQDKALLPAGSRTLLEIMAAKAGTLTERIAIVGPTERYGHLGWPVLPDEVALSGPLSGLVTALRAGWAEWNLVLACDLPYIPGPFLRQIFDTAKNSRALAVHAEGQPLCGVYHARCLPAAEAALAAKRLKMLDFTASLPSQAVPADPTWLTNINDPAAYAGLLERAAP